MPDGEECRREISRKVLVEKAGYGGLRNLLRRAQVGGALPRPRESDREISAHRGFMWTGGPTSKAIRGPADLFMFERQDEGERVDHEKD